VRTTQHRTAIESQLRFREQWWLAALIGVVTAVRLVVAATAPLAPDETYYWVWSHALAFGYLDHPPMVALWIKAGTALLGQTVLGVRLMGPLAAALASCMLFDAARLLFPGTQAAVSAVVLLNASLLLGVGTVIMTPDSSLLFFWTATLWAVARIAAGGPGVWWLVAGLCGGAALDSKYTALLLWVGVGLWVLLVPAERRWLHRWQPWAACAIGLLLFAPVVAWNAAHGWAGFARQGGRVEDWRPARALGFLAELVGGQIGLVTPLVWGLCMAGLVAAIHHAWRQRDPAWSLLVALSLPPVLVFVQHAVGDRVQGNWPAIIYPALAVAAGGIGISRRWWIVSAALGFAITALVYLQATVALIPLRAELDPIAMRLAGWDGLARQVEASRKAAGAAFVAADGYGLASELAWWLPNGGPIVGTDERWKLTTLPAAQLIGKLGLLIRDVRRADPPDPAAWTNAERIGTVTRPGAAGPDYAVYRVIAAGGAFGAVLPERNRD
jgi:4-amino-4-deoxy-L-arabinose transferase-like glycosyltransferase